MNGRLRWRGHARVALAAFGALALLAACSTTRTSATFYEPLNQRHGDDPWLVNYDGNYYLTTTQWSAIRMWKSQLGQT